MSPLAGARFDFGGKVVLVTGGTRGIGEAIAEAFVDAGATVIVTARERAGLDAVRARLAAVEAETLDVGDVPAGATLVDTLVARHGRIDVLVNNAGIGALGAFEATPMATVRELFETNTFGVMAMTQAVLSQLRARRSGVVVNVTSSVTLARMPLVAAYTASKMAIAGFTASLALELEAFNVRVKLVEPGYGPTTRFTSNGGSRMAGLIPEPYEPFAQRVFAAVAQPTAVTTERDVAEVVWRAATDESGQLRFPAGPDAVALAQSRL